MDVWHEKAARLDAWADELESGKYEQVTGKLSDGGDGRCCLGVACEAYLEATGEGTWTAYERNDDTEARAFDLPGGGGSAGVLPSKVAEWLGTQINPLLHDPENGSLACATHLNDEEKLTFPEIAARVRALADNLREPA